LGHGRYGRSLRSKRSPQFFQSFAPGSQHVNCLNGGCFQTQQVYLVPMAPGPFPVHSYAAGSLAILDHGPQRILNPRPQRILYPGPQWILNHGPHRIFNPAHQTILNLASRPILNPATRPILNPAPRPILNPVPQPILNSAPQHSLEDQTSGNTAEIRGNQGIGSLEHID
jgi:hypothetical protein